jgi:hypothetical protein
MSKKANERAEKATKDRAKKARKVQDKIEKAEKKATKAQDKIEKTEKDRVESARQSKRSRAFQKLLNDTDKSKECCEPCNYHVRTNKGEYQPCKMGHKDSGPNKEICADCSEPHYRPRK